MKKVHFSKFGYSVFELHFMKWSYELKEDQMSGIPILSNHIPVKVGDRVFIRETKNEKGLFTGRYCTYEVVKSELGAETNPFDKIYYVGLKIINDKMPKEVLTASNVSHVLKTE